MAGVFKFSAKVGEIIKGKLARGEGGRFISADELQAKQQSLSNLILQFIKDGALTTAGKIKPTKKKKAKANAKPKLSKPKKSAKPSSKRKAKKATEREQAKPGQQENIAKVQAAINLPNLDALIAYRDGSPADTTQLEDFVSRGLLEMDLDGNFRMTTEGSRLVRAAKRGDTRIANDMLSKGVERVDKINARKEEKLAKLADIGDEIADAEKEAGDIRNEMDSIGSELDSINQQLATPLPEGASKEEIKERTKLERSQQQLQKKQERLTKKLDNVNDRNRRARIRHGNTVNDINELDTKLGNFSRDTLLFKDISSFRQELRDNLRDYYLFSITRRTFTNRMTQIIVNQFEEAWLDGMSECGQDVSSVSDLTTDEREELLNKTQSQFPFIDNLADDIDRNKPIEDYYNRLDLWTRRFDEIAIRAKLMACPDDRFEWVLGPTEHCESCLALTGYIMTAQEWIDSGVLPQVANATYLLCQGFNCRCNLRKTTKAKSNRPLPVRSPKLEIA